MFLDWTILTGLSDADYWIDKGVCCWKICRYRCLRLVMSDVVIRSSLVQRQMSVGVERRESGYHEGNERQRRARARGGSQ
jgi:hypothetical protein